jgi:ornithine carbamoyltransferase
MNVKLLNRHFLKLLDFTPAEISYLLDLAADLKKAKRTGTETRYLMGRTLLLFLKKLQPGPDALLKSQLMTRGQM